LDADVEFNFFYLPSAGQVFPDTPFPRLLAYLPISLRESLILWESLKKKRKDIAYRREKAVLDGLFPDTPFPRLLN
jgi:hypothetical protein